MKEEIIHRATHQFIRFHFSMAFICAVVLFWSREQVQVENGYAMERRINERAGSQQILETNDD